jgi:hypothetical protein
MLRKGLMLMVALGLIGSSTLSARADMCFHYTVTGGGTGVAKGAEIPPKNTCAPLAIFEIDDGQGRIGAATGSICTAVDGASALYHYLYHSCIGTPYFETGTCVINLLEGALPKGGSKNGECSIMYSGAPAGGTAPLTATFDNSLLVTDCEGLNTDVPTRFSGTTHCVSPKDRPRP